MTIHTVHRSLVAIVFAATLAACDSVTPTVASTAVSCDQLGVRVSPATVTMVVGDSAILSAAAPTCASLPVPFSVTWRSSNQAIASVDSLSGRVHALTLGQASIIASVVGDTQVLQRRSGYRRQRALT